MSSVWKEIQAPAESLGGEGQRALPSAAPLHLAQLVEEGMGVPMGPGSWPLCAELPHQPSLQLIISPSMRTSLEVNLLPLNLPGEGACPCLPPFVSIHSGEHLGTTVADGARECG